MYSCRAGGVSFLQGFVFKAEFALTILSSLSHHRHSCARNTFHYKFLTMWTCQMFVKCFQWCWENHTPNAFHCINLLPQNWYIKYAADRGRPTLNCSNAFNQTLRTDPGKSTAVVVWETPFSSDNSGVVPHVSCNPASDTSFPIGETGVNCTAIDNSGNQASCEFYVNIIGNASNVIIII